MISRVRRAAIPTLLVVALAGSAFAGSERTRSDQEIGNTTGRPVAVVLTAELTWVDPPYRLGLAGGWTVEFANPSDELQALAVTVAGGASPRVRVIGQRIPGRGDRLLLGNGLEVLIEPEDSLQTRNHQQTAATSARAAIVQARHRTTTIKGDTTLEGTLAAFTPDGLTLDVDSTMIQVIVTPDTEFQDFNELSDLALGNVLEVRGELEGSTIVADRIRLRTDGGETTLEGGITSFTASGFHLNVDSESFEVVVTAATQFQNFTSLSDLEIGDWIKARGDLQGTVLTTTEVELVSGGSGGDGGGLNFDFKGKLTRLLPPDRFAMDDGRTYRVDADTVFDPIIGSYSGLAVGHYLEVDAIRTAGGGNLAVEIEYEGTSQGGQGYIEIEGRVLDITSSQIELEDGTVIALLPSTLFTGDADSWTDIVPGWSAEVYTLLELTGVFSALEVRAEDPEPATVAGQEFEPQQALVVPAAGASGDAIADRFGAEVAGRVGDLAVLLWWPEPLDDELLAELAADAEVAAVEPNYLFRDPETVRRRYPTVDRQATNAKLLDQPAVHKVRMSEAHLLADGNGIVIAVIDTGVDPLHPVLRRRLVSGGLDLVDGDLTPWEERDGVDDDGDGDIDEATGHGTFVASLIAIAAPGASILPYRVLDDDGGGTAYDLALALADALQRRVDIINLSLVYQERSTAVDLLLERAAELGIVVVTSAGNDGLTSMPFPASDSHTMAVAAVSEDGLALADFSNRTEHITLAAPGEGVYGGLDDQTFGTSSGTSMAAPFVSATVALLLSADPGLDPVLIRNALQQTGVPIQDGPWAGMVLDMAATTALVVGP